MPATGLFVERDGKLVALAEAVVELEDDLQALVARYPQLLSGDDDAAEDQRWLLIRREQGIAAGPNEGARFSLDHLFLDKSGVPTLVEVKRASDTRARREVVAQMLDYAANALAFLDPDELRAGFEAEHADPGQALQEALGSDSDEDELWSRAATNLRDGKLRLVFLADRIATELKTLIEFLNKQLVSMEVLGIEVSTFESGTTRVLRARTIGQTEQARAAKGGRTPRQWDLDTWLAALNAATDSESVEAARSLVSFAEDERLTVQFGSGALSASLQLGVKTEDAYVFPFFVYPEGAVEVQFQIMISAPYPPFYLHSKRLELMGRLNDIRGVQLPPERIDKRPSFPLRALTDQNGMAAFLDTFRWVLREAESSPYGYGSLDAARQDRDARSAGE